jgi:hypothetical protein
MFERLIGLYQIIGEKQGDELLIRMGQPACGQEQYLLTTKTGCF